MTGPLLPRNSQAGLQSIIGGIPTSQHCPAEYDETADGGLNHRCNRETDHAGVYSDGHGQLWVDREGWLR